MGNYFDSPSSNKSEVVESRKPGRLEEMEVCYSLDHEEVFWENGAPGGDKSFSWNVNLFFGNPHQKLVIGTMTDIVVMGFGLPPLLESEIENEDGSSFRWRSKKSDNDPMNIYVEDRDDISWIPRLETIYSIESMERFRNSLSHLLKWSPDSFLSFSRGIPLNIKCFSINPPYNILKDFEIEKEESGHEMILKWNEDQILRITHHKVVEEIPATFFSRKKSIHHYSPIMVSLISCSLERVVNETTLDGIEFCGIVIKSKKQKNHIYLTDNKRNGNIYHFFIHQVIYFSETFVLGKRYGPQSLRVCSMITFENSRNEELLICGCRKSMVYIYNTIKCDLILKISIVSNQKKYQVSSILNINDNYVVFGGCGGFIQLMDFKFDQVLSKKLVCPSTSNVWNTTAVFDVLHTGTKDGAVSIVTFGENRMSWIEIRNLRGINRGKNNLILEKVDEKERIEFLLSLLLDENSNIITRDSLFVCNSLNWKVVIPLFFYM